jgi:acetyl esterase/lipase
MFTDTFKGLSPDSRKIMEELGPKWSEDIVANRKVVINVYTPILSLRSLKDIGIKKNIPYGPHPRQVLDIYHPNQVSNEPLPVVLFVHGGAFVRGDKDANEHIYANFLTYFVRKGFIGINLEYRQAPEAAFPQGSKDIELSIHWLIKNSHELNIDPKNIFLVGHSAGGSHAASYILDPNVRPQNGHNVKGLILISARLKADVREDNPNAHGVKAYYGEDEKLYEERSPLNYAENLNIPLLIAISEFENPGLDVYASELFFKVSQKLWLSPTFVQVPKHNHTSIVAHLDTEEESFGLFMETFMRKNL